MIHNKILWEIILVFLNYYIYPLSYAIIINDHRLLQGDGQMDGLYANIKTGHTTKKDTRIGIIIAVLICLSVVVISSVVWFLGYRGRFTKFVGKLSASTTYAYDNESLTATVDGRTYKVSAENMYGIFGYLSLNNSGRESDKVPAGEPVTLDYGNGSRMELWDLPQTAIIICSYNLPIQKERFIPISVTKRLWIRW